MTHVVSVGLSPDRAYQIHIGEQIVEKVGEIVSSVASARRVVLVSQPEILKHLGKPVESAFIASGFQIDTICFPSGERHKNLATIERLYRMLYQLSPAIDRKTILVALGGGVVGDMVGFVAATYLRGLDYVQIPTTLLAMVDSSVGGKTGVDFLSGKNLIGAFHQPRVVVIDPVVLQTLPLREVRSGLAEVVKYGVIQEPELLSYLCTNQKKLMKRDPTVISSVVARSCKIKADIVAGDEQEITGLRAILNFGHTIGHALESATNYRRYKHGEAISIGMISAARIGEAADVTPIEVRMALCEVLRALRLPRTLPEDISDDTLIALTRLDKKAEGGLARFVLADELGKVTLRSIGADVVSMGLAQHRDMDKTG